MQLTTAESLPQLPLSVRLFTTQAAGALIRDGAKTFVEVGPGNVLSGLLRRIDASVNAISVNNLDGLEKLAWLIKSENRKV